MADPRLLPPLHNERTTPETHGSNGSMINVNENPFPAHSPAGSHQLPQIHHQQHQHEHEHEHEHEHGRGSNPYLPTSVPSLHAGVLQPLLSLQDPTGPRPHDPAERQQQAQRSSPENTVPDLNNSNVAGENQASGPRISVACRACRSRKVKCDGTKPQCEKCLLRQETCIYDIQPNRRGPDRNPGTRQRMTKKQKMELEAKVRLLAQQTGDDRLVKATEGLSGGSGGKESGKPKVSVAKLKKLIPVALSGYPSSGSPESSQSHPQSQSQSQSQSQAQVQSQTGTQRRGEKHYRFQQGTREGTGSDSDDRSNKRRKSRHSEWPPFNNNANANVDPATTTTIDTNPGPLSSSSFLISPLSASTFAPQSGSSMSSSGSGSGTSSFDALLAAAQRDSASFPSTTSLPGPASDLDGPVDSTRRISRVRHRPFTPPPFSEVPDISIQCISSTSRRLVIDPALEFYQPPPPSVSSPNNASTPGYFHNLSTPLLTPIPISQHRLILDTDSNKSEADRYRERERQRSTDSDHSGTGTGTGTNNGNGIRYSHNEVYRSNSYGFTYDYDPGYNNGDPYSIIDGPSVQFRKKTWWDDLLDGYTSDRSQSARQIAADLSFFFRSAGFQLAFFNAPFFLNTFYHAAERQEMQPALLLSILAVSKLIRSSEAELGHKGRTIALALRDQAQAALEASVNSGCIDHSVAQAALVLTVFETSCHPRYSTERCHAAVTFADSIIHALALSRLDAGNPIANTFAAKGAPAIQQFASITSEFVTPAIDRPRVGDLPPPPPPSECACSMVSLVHTYPGAQNHFEGWLQAPGWDPSWSSAEIKREECRRLCWNTIVAVGLMLSVGSSLGKPPPDLHITQPANIALMFPGEAFVQSNRLLIAPAAEAPTPRLKNSVWALYSRAMLLWGTCVAMRKKQVRSDELTEFALQAWMEARQIEEELDKHQCVTERWYWYSGRDALFNVRMCISYDFKRFMPSTFSNGQDPARTTLPEAREWLSYWEMTVNRIKFAYRVLRHEGKLDLLHRRPNWNWWFMSLVSRCLTLWRQDNTLIRALNICKQLMPSIDYFDRLWPCRAARVLYLDLRKELEQACRISGIAPPPDPSPNLSAPPDPTLLT